MMKITNVFVVILIFAAVVTKGQENFIKTSLTGILLGDINLEVERKVTEKGSIHFKAGWLDPTLSKIVPEEALTPNTFTLKESRGGISSSFEFRFYLSKKEGLQGFYIAPFLRYFNQQMLYEDEIEGHEFSVNARLSTAGAGAQLGYQWIINKKFTVDFFFLGTGLDNHQGEFKYELITEITDFDYSLVTQHIDNVFEDYEFIRKKLKHTYGEDHHTSRLPLFLPALRTGLSIGMAF